MSSFTAFVFSSLLLACFITGTLAQWVIPGPNSENGQTSNPVWQIGSKQTLSWNLPPEHAGGRVDVRFLDHDVFLGYVAKNISALSFDWIVNLAGSNNEGNEYGFWLYIAGETASPFSMSRFVNLVAAPAALSSSTSTVLTTQLPTSSTSAATRTSTLASITSASPSSNAQSSTTQPSNAQSLNAPSSASTPAPTQESLNSSAGNTSGLSTAAKVGLGVGIGLGVPILVALGLLVGLRMRRKEQVSTEKGSVYDVPPYSHSAPVPSSPQMLSSETKQAYYHIGFNRSINHAPAELGTS